MWEVALALCTVYGFFAGLILLSLYVCCVIIPRGTRDEEKRKISKRRIQVREN